MLKTAMIHTLPKHVTRSRLGTKPVVVVPLREWDRITEMLEDFDLYRSRTLRTAIKAARKDVKAGRVYTLEGVERRLKMR